jgi:hypothetical protein
MTPRLYALIGLCIGLAMGVFLSGNHYVLNFIDGGKIFDFYGVPKDELSVSVIAAGKIFAPQIKHDEFYSYSYAYTYANSEKLKFVIPIYILLFISSFLGLLLGYKYGKIKEQGKPVHLFSETIDSLTKPPYYSFFIFIVMIAFAGIWGLEYLSRSYSTYQQSFILLSAIQQAQIVEYNIIFWWPYYLIDLAYNLSWHSVSSGDSLALTIAIVYWLIVSAVIALISTLLLKHRRARAVGNMR